MPDASTAPDFHPYTITNQEKTQTLAPGGRFINVWRVDFEAPNGVHTFIEVPVSEYTPERVDQLIQQELDGIMGVHELGDEPHPANLAS